MQKETILIVDDETGPRESLRMVLKPFYTVYIADSGSRAIEMIKEKGEIDLVTLDLKMPGLQGTDLLKEIRTLRKDIEVIIITGYGSVRSAVDGIRYGVRDYLIKPFNITEIVSAVHRAMEKKRALDQFKSGLSELNRRLNEGVERIEAADSQQIHALIENLKEGLLPPRGDQQSPESPFARLQFVTVFVEALEAQNPATTGHSRRISAYVSLLAEQLRLGENEQPALQLAAFLHDLGLLGNGSSQERVQGLVHPKVGAELSTLLGAPKEIVDAVRYHHAPYGGGEDPEGLSGKRIPLFARMLALAEYFDELVSWVSENPPLRLEEAVEALKKAAGRNLDPELVDSFLVLIEKGAILAVTKERFKR